MKTGGAAFPHPTAPGVGSSQGMTLRDYFAAAALGALARLVPDVPGADAREIAEAAYILADAMLERREVLDDDEPGRVAQPDRARDS